MSKFKVKQNLPDRFIVERADGTSFSVAKRGLGAGTMTKIQHFNEGGITEEAEAQRVPASLAESIGTHVGGFGKYLGNAVGQAVVDTTEATKIMASPFVDFGKGVVQGTGLLAPAGTEAPALAEAKQAPLTIDDLPKDPAAEAAAATPAANPLKEIVDLKTSAINTTMKAEQKLAEDNIRTQNFLLTEQQKSQERFHKLAADYDKVSQDQLNDMKSAKINPKTYWSGKNVAEQIGTGIALVLGGLAGGVDKTGKNQAAEFLDNQIKQDIEVQKNNLERKDNLFAMNLKRFGTAMDAELATKRDLMVSAQAMLEINRNKASSPLAKAKADEALAGLKANVAIMNQQLAVSKSMDPVMAKITKIPEKFQTKAMEEMGTVQQLNQAKGQIQSILKEAHKANRVGQLGSIPGTSSNKIIAEAGAQLRSLLQANWKGPMTDEEANKIVGPYLSGFTDKESDVDRRGVGLFDMLKRNAKSTPTLQLYGLLPKPAYVPPTTPRQPRK